MLEGETRRDGQVVGLSDFPCFPTSGDYSLVPPSPVEVWPAFNVRLSHFPGRAIVTEEK